MRVATRLVAGQDSRRQRLVEIDDDDLFPTIAKLAGQGMPSDRVIDGKDIGDVLLGKPGAKSPHKTLFYEKDGVRRAMETRSLSEATGLGHRTLRP